MQKPYDLVHSVFEAYKGLPGKLARITGKSEQIFKTYGYEPRTDNPAAYGNKSFVDHFMEGCELFEAAEPGAGRCLSSRVHGELSQRFTENDLSKTGRDLLCEVVDESCDVEKWLASHDLDSASRNDLIGFQRECDEAIEAIYDAKSQARAKQKEIEMRRQVASNGRRV